jgi:carbon monoxide dehydrogenase subunit G
VEADRSAPICESGEIFVDARPELVWDTLTDLKSWPGWMPGVKTMEVDGPLVVGTTFRWKAGPGTIRSGVRESDRPRSIGWTGQTLGMSAAHVWRMEGQGDGTRVFTAESWSGPLARFLRRSMSKQLKKSLDEGLPALKKEAEARAASAR